MAADALAPYVATSSATKVLIHQMNGSFLFMRKDFKEQYNKISRHIQAWTKYFTEVGSWGVNR